MFFLTIITHHPGESTSPSEDYHQDTSLDLLVMLDEHAKTRAVLKAMIDVFHMYLGGHGCFLHES